MNGWRRSWIVFDLSGADAKLKELEQQMSEPEFWQDPEKAGKLNQERTNLVSYIERWRNLYSRLEDLKIMCELALEDDDESLEEELVKDCKALTSDYDKAELGALLSGEFCSSNAILSIHPGAGGTESQDWAQMLMRMYVRWAENNGYSVETLDFLPGDEAGIKSVTFLVKGRDAYGYLKSEKGIHRLVRISPFDASSRRHTSFVSVEVDPEIDDDIEVEIDPNDLRIETYRAGGAGGQHVNKTDSAVRIVHEPTGIVVQCQNERSQHKNKATAMKILKARLYKLRQDEQEEKKAEARGEKRDIAWGNQIRSYVFHPYNMVKDHRTNIEVGNVDAVMDGWLDPFVQTYLREQFRKNG
jgi:peptide chain release factor 2